MEELFDEVVGEIPEEWLRKQELMLTEEEKAQIEAMGGWEKLMETLKERLEEQKAVTKVATSGSVPPVSHRSVLTVTTPKVYASVSTSRVTAAPLKFGTNANTRTWTTPSR